MLSAGFFLYKYPFEVKIRDNTSEDKDNLYLPVSLKEAIKLFKNDDNGHANLIFSRKQLQALLE